ncbi:MAG TPA: TraR/DksA C4-type zinc finger protein [Actinomycetota bacterium]|nr:TraR/DksA C4-type zinc finger protein [Actinomycetota bacterium]
MAKSPVRSKPKAVAPARRASAKPTVRKLTPKKSVAKPSAKSKKSATKAKPVGKKSVAKAKPVAKKKLAVKAKAVAKKKSPVKPKPTTKKPAPKSKQTLKAKPKAKSAPKAKAPAKPPAKSKAESAPKTAAPTKSKASAKAAAETPVVVERKPLPPRPKPKPEVIRKAKRVNFDAKTLRSIKSDLGLQRVELAQQIKEIEEATFNSTQSEMSGETGYDEDSADAGTATFEREKDLSIANNIQDLIDKIDKALQKIDDGTYGLCESCGDPISGERLKALPYVLLCIRCKKAEERR